VAGPVVRQPPEKPTGVQLEEVPTGS